jgi:hypothetical protein
VGFVIYGQKVRQVLILVRKNLGIQYTPFQTLTLLITFNPNAKTRQNKLRYFMRMSNIDKIAAGQLQVFSLCFTRKNDDKDIKLVIYFLINFLVNLHIFLAQFLWRFCEI